MFIKGIRYQVALGIRIVQGSDHLGDVRILLPDFDAQGALTGRRQHERFVEVLGDAMRQVLARLDRLEDTLQVEDEDRIETDENGNWIGSDFSI